MNTIGHYCKNATTCSYTVQLNELTDDNFNAVISSVPKCPYDKKTQVHQYKLWKTSHVPIVYFTYSRSRPKPESSAAGSSCYAVIDIDDNTEKYVSEHPAVCCINYTGGGTHIFIHSYAFGHAETPVEWQNTYDAIAYEIWYELCEKYQKQVMFDGHNATHTQGCFLWNTEWVPNKLFDRNWKPAEAYIYDGNKNIIDEMYTAGTYTRQTNNISHKANKDEEKPDYAGAMTAIASKSALSTQIVKDFKTLRNDKFIEKYTGTYTLEKGTTPVFTDYTDYQGNTYPMYKTNGQMITLWQPYMTKNECYIKEGGRMKSLWCHLVELCQFEHSKNQPIDADKILFDAVCWVENYCENPNTVLKFEILSCVKNVLESYTQYDSRLHTDKRMFVTGDIKIDTDTGETIPMDKPMKISANAKCRKTERIIETVSVWDPSKTIDENIADIKHMTRDISDLSDNTLKNYIETAKSMHDLVKSYPWLTSIEINTNRKGRPNQQITIQRIVDGKTFTFNSKHDCMKFLKITSRTFSKFIKGISKLNKTYLIISGSNI